MNAKMQEMEFKSTRRQCSNEKGNRGSGTTNALGPS